MREVHIIEKTRMKRHHLLYTYRVTQKDLNDFSKMGVAFNVFFGFLSIIMANFFKNLVTIASSFLFSMVLLD